jgi:hypothetical protein
LSVRRERKGRDDTSKEGGAQHMGCTKRNTRHETRQDTEAKDEAREGRDEGWNQGVLGEQVRARGDTIRGGREEARVCTRITQLESD